MLRIWVPFASAPVPVTFTLGLAKNIELLLLIADSYLNGNSPLCQKPTLPCSRQRCISLES